jgi:hypothetical protein
LSDARFPCLEVEVDGFPFLAFPQLSVMTRHGIYRLDVLVGVMVEQSRVWINLEIDGGGHDNRYDLERQRNLDLPTARLTEQELKAPDCFGLAIRRLKQSARVQAPTPTKK